MNWTSIKKKRPPHGELVLLSYVSKIEADNWVVCGERRYRKYWNQFQDRFTDCNIFPTHWAPLPEPPKL